MRFTVKSLGKLEEATIDLADDLIVLTGPNNTSKTYVAHAVYGFCHNILWSLRSLMGPVILSGMKDEGSHAEIDVLAAIDKILVHTFGGMAVFNQVNIHRVLGAPEAFARSARVELDMAGAEIEAAKARLLDMEDHREIDEVGTFVDKSKGTGVFRFTRPIVLEGGYLGPALTTAPLLVLSSAVARAFFNGLTSPYIITAERSAIELFSREIAAKRFDPQSDDDPAPVYPLALTEGLKEAQRMAAGRNLMSPYAELADRLDRDLLGGKIEVGPHGESVYVPEGTTERLSMNLSSSSVKALAALSFFLRHRAQRGHLLILDEPELNLHPHNQRLVARLLARMVRGGIKVMISTHSDYILRELNNLMMLSDDKGGSVRARHGYDEGETLPRDRVGAYLFDGARAHPIPIEPAGIGVTAIDREIRDLNASSRDIYFSLFEGDGP